MHEVSVGVMSAAFDVRPVLSMAPPRCEIGRWGELSEVFSEMFEVMS